MPVKCKLSRLMGDRRIKMTELAEATGLARSTIWHLYHDKSEKVEYRVLGALCKYFNCQPGDLLVYEPD